MSLEKEWTTKEGYPAQVLIMEAGHRCGYVKIPVSHPYSGIDYEEMDICVHGGLTYKSTDEDDGGTWIGFDCAHLGDAPDPELIADSYRHRPVFGGGIIRSLQFCIDECESMAEQLEAGK